MSHLIKVTLLQAFVKYIYATAGMEFLFPFHFIMFAVQVKTLYA
jgi:hypothetical protein